MMMIKPLICTAVAVCLVKCNESLTGDIHYLPRLVSHSCEKKRCPAPGNMDLYQQFCNYNCPPHHRFVCLEDAEENVIDFCMPDNLECEPGLEGNVTIDVRNTSRAVVHKVPCASGTYRQYKSGCLDPCVKQVSASSLPHEFKPFEPGNTIEPMKVVCDHEKGYCSITNRSWFYYDDHFFHRYRNNCEKIEKNLCPDAQRPLKNESFVHWSDDEKEFVPNVESTEKPLQPTKKITETVPPIDVTSQSDPLTQEIIVVIILVPVVIVSGVAIFAIVVCRKKCCSHKTKQIVYKGDVTLYNGNVTFGTSSRSEDTNQELRNLLVDCKDENALMIEQNC